VAGALAPSELGRTLVHEHVVISLPGEALDPTAPPDRREIVAMAVDELQKLKDHGVATLVDPCPIELGRDPELYAEVSQRSGINIVFATGFYMEAMGIPAYWRARDAEEIAELYLKELTDGVGRTGLRPGVIKAATGLEVTAAEARCLAGAAKAQSQAGCAIITHTEHSRHGERQQEIFAENGADLSRILIGHQDEHPTPDPLLRLAERGTFVGVDRVGTESLAPDDTRADNVAALVKAGFGNRVCLSHDCVCTLTAPRFPFALPPERRPKNVLEGWAKARKPLTHIFTDFAPRLAARGVDADALDQILRDNPRRLLAGGA
jgi:phosphotriesterase-related protein